MAGHSHIYTGNTTNNPSESQLVKWAQEYGEIYQIRMGTQRWVVVSSPEAVKVSNRIGTWTSKTLQGDLADVASNRKFLTAKGL